MRFPVSVKPFRGQLDVAAFAGVLSSRAGISDAPVRASMRGSEAAANAVMLLSVSKPIAISAKPVSTITAYPKMRVRSS